MIIENNYMKEETPSMKVNQHKWMVLLAAFILVQPLIDVLTTGSIFLLDTSITIGVLFRLAYMAIMAGWIVFAATKSKRARLYLLYLTGFAILVVTNFLVSMSIKDPYYLMEEVTFYTKAVYFHVVLFGFLLVLEKLKENGTNIRQLLINYFLIPALIISAVFIIAQVTGTSLDNYARSKKGWTGWFYAGNEIGAIMAILLPITALYAAQKTKRIKDIVKWWPFVLLSISMLALGTKVGYGGILIVLLSVLAGSLILMAIKNKVESRESVRANFGVSAILIVVLIAVTPFTPVFGNMYSHFDILGIDFNKTAVEGPLDGEDPEKEEPVITAEQFENLIFSSREVYKSNYQTQFSEAPMIQKLFGMGFSGNYEKVERHKPLKMIEMDFHDWFYSFGIIGFLYMLAPLLYFSIKHIISVGKQLTTSFNYFTILTGISFLLGIGISYTAGHVLMAPAVSIFLAFLLAALTHIGQEEGHARL